MARKANIPKPILVLDLDKISVHELIKMIERGDKNAKYIMMSIGAAIARSSRY